MTSNDECNEDIRERCRREADSRHRELLARVSGLHSSVEDVKIKQTEICMIVNEACSKVGTINKIVTGNGTPKDGLIAKVQDLEGDINRASKLTWILVGVLATTIIGGVATFILSVERHMHP